MTIASYSTSAAQDRTEERYPAYGILPRTRLGRIFMAWGAVNVLLALLPVFNVVGNSAAIGPLGMPVTLFYCYAVFTLNCILGAVYYLTRGRAWVAMIEKSGGAKA